MRRSDSSSSSIEQANESRPGFGSLTARVPGQGKSHALRLASHKLPVKTRFIQRSDV